MSLQTKYKQYLAKPTVAALSADASIHYIPTLSTFSKSHGILKHLESQEHQLKVKENFLNVIESDHALCVEAETTIHFLQGGSAYLPGLDNNFLADRIVTIPVTHVVEFDGNSKIQQIRLLWDQASLLKSVEIIGTRAQNWPIYDGKDQSRLIASSVSHATHTIPIHTKPNARAARKDNNLDSNGHLSLFEPVEFERISSPGNAVEPRESAKPRPRPYDEVFGDDEPRSPSPTKGDYFKAGAGTNFKSNRLFDDQTQENTQSIKTNPSKFDHFDMNETSIETFKTKGPGPKANKHAAHWDFADFATPQKPAPTNRKPNERSMMRNFDDIEPSNPDIRASYRPVARKDAAAHFDFGDASPPAEKRKTVQPADSAPLSSITNNARRNFDTHFDMSDVSPPKKAQVQNENVKPSVGTGPKKTTRNMTTTSWDFYNEEPVVERGITIAGDGMGGRKTAEKGWWEHE